MPKVDIDLVKFVLQRNELDERTVAHILEEINEEASIQADQEAKPPPVKKQFLILLSDPQGELANKEMTGWVLQIPEEDAPTDAVGRIVRAAYAYNLTPKGRRVPARTIGEACEAVTARLLKEENVWVKTKEAVWALTTDNQIPTDNFDAG